MLIPICTFSKDVDIFATDTLNRGSYSLAFLLANIWSQLAFMCTFGFPMVVQIYISLLNLLSKNEINILVITSSGMEEHFLYNIWFWFRFNTRKFNQLIYNQTIEGSQIILNNIIAGPPHSSNIHEL